MVKLNISSMLPFIIDDDEHDILTLLKLPTTHSPEGPAGVSTTEYLTNNDTRQWNEEFKTAKEENSSVLFKLMTFKIIKKSEVPHGANILGGRCGKTREENGKVALPLVRKRKKG